MAKKIESLIFMIICMSSLSAQPQKLDTIDILTSTTWVISYNNKIIEGEYIKYDYKNRVIINDSWNGEKKSHKYYLSNEVEEIFDTTKVGSILNGKYIIVEVWRIILEGSELARLQMRDSIHNIVKLNKFLEEGEVRDCSSTQCTQPQLYNVGVGRERSINVYEIKKISKKELVLQRISKEPIMGGGSTTYIPYDENLKQSPLNEIG